MTTAASNTVATREPDAAPASVLYEALAVLGDAARPDDITQLERATDSLACMARDSGLRAEEGVVILKAVFRRLVGHSPLRVTSQDPEAGRVSGQRTRGLEVLLWIRGLVGLGYGLTFLLRESGGWNAMFETLRDYLVVDGTIGIALAVLLAKQGLALRRRHLGMLAVVLFVDAVGRVAAGVALRIWRGIPGFPVTAVLYLSLVAVFTAAVGVTEGFIAGGEEASRLSTRHAPPELAVAMLMPSAVISLLFGIAGLFFVGTPAMFTRVLAAYVLSVSLLMFGLARPHGRGIVG